MKKRIEIYSFVAGLIFLISGMAKALDMAAFSSIITRYGVGNLQFIGPLIVFAETSVGLLLVFQVWQKWAAFGGAALVTGFTVIYAYGLVFKGVEDCGCFGNISVLNTSPVLTFFRNTILFYLLIATWRKGENKSNLNKWIIFISLIFMYLIAFISGYTYRIAGKNAKSNAYHAQAIENSVLNEFITTSQDSTYLVFAFTYSCPHCLNSIANLNGYESSGVVDKVIALAMSDSIAEQAFKKAFDPNFVIKNHSKAALLRLTNNFPTSYYIRNDSIITEFSGQLPCPPIFSALRP
jgi:uncharacterized membrane protein YphA (DoxX/SURF4 family)